MKVLDPGHEYLLDSLDGDQENRLVFVKREGEKYQGNIGHHSGTTMQEVLRALLDRAVYVNNQIHDEHTDYAIQCMQSAIMHLEMRAAIRHGRSPLLQMHEVVSGANKCSKCGHVGCKGECYP